MRFYTVKMNSSHTIMIAVPDKIFSHALLLDRPLKIFVSDFVQYDYVNWSIEPWVELVFICFKFRTTTVCNRLRLQRGSPT